MNSVKEIARSAMVLHCGWIEETENLFMKNSNPALKFILVSCACSVCVKNIYFFELLETIVNKLLICNLFCSVKLPACMYI